MTFVGHEPWANPGTYGMMTMASNYTLAFSSRGGNFPGAIGAGILMSNWTILEKLCSKLHQGWTASAVIRRTCFWVRHLYFDGILYIGP